jgi:hypothetical protein
MKLGAENRNTLIAAAVLALIALVFAVRAVYSLLQAPPAAPVPAAGDRGPQAARVRNTKPAKLPAANALDPTLRLELLQASEGTEYTGTGRNIFAPHREPPPRIERAVVNPGPPPPVCPGDPRCPPPPIPLKFYGFQVKPGEPKRVFLAMGEDTFIAAEGEIVNRRYRVVRIGVNSVEIEDVLSNNRQTIPLTAG